MSITFISPKIKGPLISPSLSSTTGEADINKDCEVDVPLNLPNVSEDSPLSSYLILFKKLFCNEVDAMYAKAPDDK